MRKYSQNFLILLDREERIEPLPYKQRVLPVFTIPKFLLFPIVSFLEIVVLASKLPDSYIKYLYRWIDVP
jgi:hypothetical protein